MLKTFVSGQRVLGAVFPLAELADIEGVRPLVLILEMPLKGVVAAEVPLAERTLLWLVDPASHGWWNLKHS